MAKYKIIRRIISKNLLLLINIIIIDLDIYYIIYEIKKV